MLSAYAILKIVAGTFGLGTQLDCASDPTKAGCENAFALPAPAVGGGAPGGGVGGGGAPGGGVSP
jgi:hypothetical protein